MKFFHISDLHIGKQLYGYSLLEDQSYVLEQVLDAMEREHPDALLIAGDIYDKPVPSGEAVQLFDHFLTKVSEDYPNMPVFIIAGNHDSASRIDYAGGILRRNNIHIVGTPPQSIGDRMYKVTMSDAYGEIDIYTLPFFKPGNVRGLFTEEENENYVNQIKETGVGEFDVYFEKLLARETMDESKRNVLLTHQFFVPENAAEIVRTESEVITVGTLDHISNRHLQPFDYVAMGHIHRAQKCGEQKYRYCGTLMPYSLSEESDEKAITVVTLHERGQQPQIETIPVSPLRKVRKLRGTKEELLALAKKEGDVQEDGNVVMDDYVSLVVTDEEPGRFVREELGIGYSRILEIRYDNRFMRHLLGESEGALLSDNYVEMFEQFYEMRNGVAMNEEERQILSEMLYGAEVEEK
ncbi:MAG: exonuclease SbcCD subunit D [Lachnospiraceae bacterium]|nr:exonuclease SbcCD subunit D [Lachnospiraceae bacterium]